MKLYVLILVYVAIDSIRIIKIRFMEISASHITNLDDQWLSHSPLRQKPTLIGAGTRLVFTTPN